MHNEWRVSLTCSWNDVFPLRFPGFVVEMKSFNGDASTLCQIVGHRQSLNTTSDEYANRIQFQGCTTARFSITSLNLLSDVFSIIRIRRCMYCWLPRAFFLLWSQPYPVTPFDTSIQRKSFVRKSHQRSLSISNTFSTRIISHSDVPLFFVHQLDGW